METKEPKEEIVIIDETEPCPYIKGETARMPLRMPLEKVSHEMTDHKLSLGYRRTGIYLYDTICPSCQACEPIRIDCQSFQFSRNQKRILKRGDQRYHQKVMPLIADQERVDLFNKHRQVRGLADHQSDIDVDGYTWGFVRSCFDSFEISYWQNDKLVCAGICDRGATSISAVYTFYDPDVKGDSLGTYSILKQIEYCRSTGMLSTCTWAITSRPSPHMKYKSQICAPRTTRRKQLGSICRLRTNCRSRSRRRSATPRRIPVQVR